MHVCLMAVLKFKLAILWHFYETIFYSCAQNLDLSSFRFSEIEWRFPFCYKTKYISENALKFGT